MSPGHIYHYFENKEAIINAIVQQDLEIALNDISESANQDGDVLVSLLSHVSSSVQELLEMPKAAMRLEVLAEAGRNPTVAAMVREADREIRSRLRGLLMESPRGSAYLAEGDLDSRVEVLMVLFIGLTTRAIVNPGLDKEALAHIVRRTLEQILA